MSNITNTIYHGRPYGVNVTTAPVATGSNPGIVKPDGSTITLDTDGTIHALATGTAELIHISQSEYDALTQQEKEDSTKAYFIYDAQGGGSEISVDTEMSDSSENAVQNKVIKSYVDTEVGQVDTEVTTLSSSVSQLGIDKRTVKNATLATMEAIGATLQEGEFLLVTDSQSSGSPITYVDNLTSTATNQGLSANQGRVLKEFIDKNHAINEFVVESSAWTASTASADYPYEATISTDKYTDSFIASYVDIVPSDGSPFFSADEVEAKANLNSNIVLASAGVTLYAKEAISTSIKLRICGEA